MIFGEPGLVDSLENGFSVLSSFFFVLPTDVRTVIISAVALLVLLGIFNLLSR